MLQMCRLFDVLLVTFGSMPLSESNIISERKERNGY